MAELPDIHHKMSKKIAQLTKVIFHLNTKSDEAALYHQAQAEAYEKEIDRIVREANNIISKQRELLEKHKQAGDVGAMVAQIQTQYEEAKGKAQTDIALLRSRTEERETAIRKESREQLDIYKREIGELKAAFQKQLSQFEGKQLTSASTIDDIERRHKQEIDAYVKEQNAKYSKLLQEKLDSEDALRDEMDKRLKALNAEWEKKLKETVDKIKAEERSKAQKLFDQAGADFLKKLDQAEAQIKELASSNSNLTSANRILTDQKSKLEVMMEDLQKELKKLNQLVTD